MSNRTKWAGILAGYAALIYMAATTKDAAVIACVLVVSGIILHEARQ